MHLKNSTEIPEWNAKEVASVTLCLSGKSRLDSALKRFHSGSVYVVLDVEKSFNNSAVLWNVSVLLSDDTAIDVLCTLRMHTLK